jgi:hypothetical protein
MIEAKAQFAPTIERLAEYKQQFPSIKINSAPNLMLLCPEHHQLVDRLAAKQHPPDILFRMKSEKSVLISESITERLEHQTTLEIGIEDYHNEFNCWSRGAVGRHNVGKPGSNESLRIISGALNSPCEPVHTSRRSVRRIISRATQPTVKDKTSRWHISGGIHGDRGWSNR